MRAAALGSPEGGTMQRQGSATYRKGLVYLGYVAKQIAQPFVPESCWFSTASVGPAESAAASPEDESRSSADAAAFVTVTDISASSPDTLSNGKHCWIRNRADRLPGSSFTWHGMLRPYIRSWAWEAVVLLIATAVLACKVNDVTFQTLSSNGALIFLLLACYGLNIQVLRKLSVLNDSLQLQVQQRKQQQHATGKGKLKDDMEQLLQPLLTGAWVHAELPGEANVRCFVQLSGDASMLSFSSGPQIQTSAIQSVRWGACGVPRSLQVDVAQWQAATSGACGSSGGRTGMVGGCSSLQLQLESQAIVESWELGLTVLISLHRLQQQQQAAKQTRGTDFGAKASTLQRGAALTGSGNSQQQHQEGGGDLIPAGHVSKLGSATHPLHATASCGSGDLERIKAVMPGEAASTANLMGQSRSSGGASASIIKQAGGLLYRLQRSPSDSICHLPHATTAVDSDTLPDTGACSAADMAAAATAGAATTADAATMAATAATAATAPASLLPCQLSGGGPVPMLAQGMGSGGSAQVMAQQQPSAAPHKVQQLRSARRSLSFNNGGGGSSSSSRLQVQQPRAAGTAPAPDGFDQAVGIGGDAAGGRTAALPPLCRSLSRQLSQVSSTLGMIDTAPGASDAPRPATADGSSSLQDAAAGGAGATPARRPRTASRGMMAPPPALSCVDDTYGSTYGGPTEPSSPGGLSSYVPTPTITPLKDWELPTPCRGGPPHRDPITLPTPGHSRTPSLSRLNTSSVLPSAFAAADAQLPPAAVTAALRHVASSLPAGDAGDRQQVQQQHQEQPEEEAERGKQQEDESAALLLGPRTSSGPLAPEGPSFRSTEGPSFRSSTSFSGSFSGRESASFSGFWGREPSFGALAGCESFSCLGVRESSSSGLLGLATQENSIALSGAAAPGQQQSCSANSLHYPLPSSSSSSKQSDQEQQQPEQAAAATAATVQGLVAAAAGSSGLMQVPAPAVNGVPLQVPVEVVAYEDLVFGRVLGQGAQGMVHVAVYLDTPVAIKKTHCWTEVAMSLHAGLHDNVVSLRGLCHHHGAAHLVMEYCTRGTLDELVHNQAAAAANGASAANGPPTKWEAARLLPMLRSIARGMFHLHSRRPAILHRDLKPANVFLGRGMQVKVGDFGMSRTVGGSVQGAGLAGALERQLTPNVIGTAAYSAPEVLGSETPTAAWAGGGGRGGDPSGHEDVRKTLKADVYSFGVTLWEVLERRRPFAGMDNFQIQAMWLYSPEEMRLPRLRVAGNADEVAKRLMGELQQLVDDCTQVEPERRPSFREVLVRIRRLQADYPASSNAGGGTGTAQA